MSATDFSRYSPEERAAYLGALAAFATADRVAKPQEVQFFRGLAEATGLPPEEVDRVVQHALTPDSGALEESLDALRGSDLRFNLVNDAIQFAQSDGEYSDEEQQLLAQVAQRLGVNAPQFDALHDYNTGQVAGGASGAASLFDRVGIPKGALTGILAVLGPMVLQRMFGGGRTAASSPAAGVDEGGGGGLMGVLGQVLGGMGGSGGQQPIPQGAPAGGGGGMMDILGQVLGGGRGGAPTGGGGGLGLGQIMQVLGAMGGRGGGLFGGGRAQAAYGDEASTADGADTEPIPGAIPSATDQEQQAAPQSAPRPSGGYGALSGMLGRLFG